jgi:hypothetical protein
LFCHYIMKRSLFIVVIFATLFSCREEYTPPVITANSNYLVVDGMINSGNTDSTVIKLSRTVKLSGTIGTKAETKAKVMVESSVNTTTYILKETVAGTYISNGHLNLDKTAQYRLRVITSDSKTYLSDFAPVKEAPLIDSLYYNILSSGVQINLNAHDGTNNTRYYRWEYAETWIFHAEFSSSYIYDPVTNTVNLREPKQDVLACWLNNYSPDIALGTTQKLTQDVMSAAPITFITGPSEKLRIRYSILVKQYALTAEAFAFWQLLKKDTEQLGSIFDAQPSQIKGNIHNINDASEPVFGYISVGTAQQKRIFIDHGDVPDNFGTDDPYSACTEENSQIGVGPGMYVTQFGSLSYLPLYTQDPQQLVYKSGTRACSDCTLRGSNSRPVFWQDRK